MMKGRSQIVCLCAALFALIIIGGLVHTAPALAWDTWPAGTHNDPNHTWTVVFDKAMNTATINSQNIYVSNDIQGSSRVTGVSVRASDSKHALVAPPAGGWKSGASYYLIITQKVLTSANRPLKDEVRMPFHIKAITKAVPTIDVINNGSQMIVKVNGTQLSLKQSPYTVSGHPMVPIKEIAQALGAAVDWDAKNKKMTIMGDKVAELTIGSKTARINGVSKTMDNPAVIVGGSAMVPLRFVGEALGAKVNNTSTNNQSEDVLTSEYWIPDLSRTYVYSDSEYCLGNQPSPGQTTIRWKKESNGSYRMSLDSYGRKEDGTLGTEGRHLTNKYIFDGSSILWTYIEDSQDQAGGYVETLTSGKREIIRKVKSGQSWKNNYITEYVDDIYYSETVYFLGFCNINCLGKPQRVAHIKIAGSDGSAEGYYNEEYWLAKGIGIVKSVQNHGKIYYTYELVSIK